MDVTDRIVYLSIRINIGMQMKRVIIYTTVSYFYLMTEEKRSSEDDIFLSELRRWKDIIPELMD
jgi:hypothetical protein